MGRFPFGEPAHTFFRGARRGVYPANVLLFYDCTRGHRPHLGERSAVNRLEGNGGPVSNAWLYVSDEQGETPLSRGLGCGYEPAVNLILTISEPADTSNEDPIFDACRESRVSDVRQMLEDGVNLDIADDYGLTPLHWAAITGCTDLAKLLINRGAHVNPRDGNVTDMTPTALARWLGYQDLAKLLSDNGGLE